MSTKPDQAQSFDFPATRGAAERTAVLGRHLTAPTMARDHFDPVVLQQLGIERIAVVAAIADQSLGQVGEKARVERRRDEVRLIR